MQGHRHIAAGCWRMHSEPMQAVFWLIGHERVHFEAPPSSQVPEECSNTMKLPAASCGELHWFNDSAPGGKHEIRKAQCAHFTLTKTRLLDRFRNQLNDRQLRGPSPHAG